MADLLSFLGMFFYGLKTVFIWTFVILSLSYMIYAIFSYILNYLFLIPIGLFKKDKYFVVGMMESFNDHIWKGNIEEYKEFILYDRLLDFYISLIIFNCLAALYSSFLFSNVFYSLSFVFLFIFCLLKAYKLFPELDKAKDILNKYYESLRENW